MTGRFSFSGKADRIHILGDRALVIDFKSARGEVVSAVGNMQLRSLAVLVWKNVPGIASVTAAIIQPWASPQVSVCEYSRGDLALASHEIKAALFESQKPTAPRIPGERQCKYCRALSVCPEAKAVVLSVTDYPTVGRFRLEIEPARMASFLDSCALAERVIDSFRAWAKESLTADPDSIPGWRLKPGAVKSAIVDVRPIYERLSRDYAVSGEEFAEIVKVTKKDLTALVKRATGFKGGELESHIETLLAGCTEEKQNAPSLERVKEE